MDQFDRLTLGDFSARLGESSPTPGGGAAAALTGMMAAALAHMVAAMTVGRRRYRDNWDVAEKVVKRAAVLRQEFLAQAAADAVVYEQVKLVLQHYSADNSATAVRAIEDALIAAAQVPLEVARNAVETARLATEMVLTGNVHGLGDAVMACHLARAAVHGSAMNIRLNLREIQDEKLRRRLVNEGNRLARQVDILLAEALEAVENRLANDTGETGRRGRGTRPKDGRA